MWRKDEMEMRVKGKKKIEPRMIKGKHNTYITYYASLERERKKKKRKRKREREKKYIERINISSFEGGNSRGQERGEP